MVIIKCCEMLGADQSRMIRNILERGCARVVLDKEVVKKEGGGLEVIDEPEQIKQRVRQHFQEWNAHRYLGTPTDRLEKVYAPREDIDAVWYDGVVIAVEEEELDEVLRVSATGKAGGPSGIVNEMLRRLGPLGRDMLWALCTEVITSSHLLGEWCKGILYPIPKTATWEGDLEAVRPITLLEHAWKLCARIVVGRMCRVLSERQVLQANNNSVLRGTSVGGPLHIVNAVMEDARENRKPLWMVFQDIRHAFDSVEWVVLEHSMRWLWFPEAYVALFRDACAGRTCQVVTPFSLCDSFEVECGLGQGAVEAPLHWRVVYDPLLSLVDDLELGYRVQRGRDDNLTLTGGVEGPVSVSSGAFVDDTVWLMGSKGAMERVLSAIMEFFTLTGITVNPKKTSLLVIGKETVAGGAGRPFIYLAEPPLRIPANPQVAGVRYLG